MAASQIKFMETPANREPLVPAVREEEESNIQVVCDCPEAKKVWSCFMPPEMFSEFCSLPLKEWMLWNFSSKRLGTLSRW